MENEYIVVEVGPPAKRGEKTSKGIPKVRKVRAHNFSFALHKDDGRKMTQEELRDRAERNQ